MAKVTKLQPGDPGYIGRGHPPAAHQYKKGVSGNPAGRPKGRNRLLTQLRDELESPIGLPNGMSVSLPKLFASSLFAQVSRADGIKPLELALRLHRIATSVGATITGHGANLIIVDDPNRAKDVSSEAHRTRVNAYFDQELFTRLNDKRRDAVILVMQRLHENDLTGHVLARGKWTHTVIPAQSMETTSYRVGPRQRDQFVRPEGDILLPTLNTDGTLEDLRATMGSLSFEAQYQQNPTPADGAVIKRSWPCSPCSHASTCCSWRGPTNTSHWSRAQSMQCDFRWDLQRSLRLRLFGRRTANSLLLLEI